MRRKLDPEKSCERCGDPMERKRFNGRLEDLSAFAKRRFCTLSCANTREEVTLAGHRWRAKQLRGNVCSGCGAVTSLQAHHKDRDVTNNSPGNIATLCDSCHRTEHAA